MRASRMASSAPAKVGLCEMPFDLISSERAGGLGGTCVIRGCVPKKLFVYGSSFSSEFCDAVGYGWHIDKPKLDWEKLLLAKTKEVERLNGIYTRLLNNSNVSLHEGSGKLIDAHTIEITAHEVRRLPLL